MLKDNKSFDVILFSLCVLVKLKFIIGNSIMISAINLIKCHISTRYTVVVILPIEHMSKGFLKLPVKNRNKKEHLISMS